MVNSLAREDIKIHAVPETRISNILIYNISLPFFEDTLDSCILQFVRICTKTDNL